jgi:hypothetical protein
MVMSIAQRVNLVALEVTSISSSEGTSAVDHWETTVAQWTTSHPYLVKLHL